MPCDDSLIHPSPSVASIHPQAHGVVLQLADSTIAACNATAQTILGMTLDQLQDASSTNCPWQTIHPDGTPFPGATHPAMVTLSTGEPCFDVEMGFYRPDGNLIWMSLETQPLFQRDSTTPYAVTVLITPIAPPSNTEGETVPDQAGQEQIGLEATQAALQTALRQLNFHEAQYRLLAEAIPQFVFVTTAEGQNEYVNQQFCDYTGLSLEQMLNLDWLSIIHPDDQERTRDRWLASVGSGEFYEIEYRFRRFDGTYRWFLGQGLPMKDEQGQLIKWFGTCTDIDAQKRIEVERLQLLQQEQMARQAAEQANRVKDEFLAVISHELRTPLNPILGWSKLLRKGNLETVQAQKALETIERNAKQQAQLIEDLLDVSRILQGKLTLNLAPVDLSLITVAAIETVRLSAESKSIQLRSSLAQNIGMMMGDVSRLNQILNNLLTNAVKFTPEGGRVDVRLSRNEGKAQLQVSDTGKGIHPDFLPHLFEAFRQEDSTNTRQFGGLGLGLSIVRQLVELHGGTVSAQSAGEGQGATFTVCFAIASGQSSATAALVEDEPPLELASARILVVDDMIDSREFVAFVLEQSGAVVTQAASAQEALESLTRANFDVLVTDIGMPDMNGYQLVQRIRTQTTAFQNIPAIALTAYASESDQTQVLDSGFQCHLAKPVDSEALLNAIVVLRTRQS
jgi:PAS domain S-box-containing protein